MYAAIEDFKTPHETLFGAYCTKRRITATPLVFHSHGANNILYRTEINRQIMICKTGINSAFRHLSREYSIVTTLRLTRGFTDYYRDPESGDELFIHPFIKGTHPAYLSEQQLHHLGKTIASYHYRKSTVKDIPHENAVQFINHRILPVAQTPANSPWYTRFIEAAPVIAVRCENHHRAHTPKSAVLVHGDLIPPNIIITPRDAIKIIDWEGARYDEPEADLATCIKGFKLNDSETCTLLSGYGYTINRDRLSLRLVMHYLQVVAWRLTIKVGNEMEDQQYNTIVDNLEEELAFIENKIEMWN